MKSFINSKHSLEWFIGFAEGDGSWQIQNTPTSKRCIFIINQKDPQVLYKIKKLLKFGTVRGPYLNKKQKTSYFRYRVGNLKNINTLIEICNGRLVLSKTKNRFQLFVEFYNSLIVNNDRFKQITLVPSSVSPTLKDGWLSGFIDAEGCFSASLKRRNDFIRGIALTFSLKQKSEEKVFKHLKVLIGGSYSFNEKKKVCELKLEGILNREVVIDYLSEYSLQSNKAIAFSCFKKLHVRLTDGKFQWRLTSPRAKSRLIRLAKNINNF